MNSENGSTSPVSGRVTIDGRSYAAGTIIRLLEEFVSEERKARIDAVLPERIRSVVPVIEGVHDLGNVGAVIRSAEGLGFNELHVIDRGDRYKNSRRTSQGAEKWLDVIKWQSTPACVEHLKEAGHVILVTHLDAGRPLETFDFTVPTAVVFGNEADGVSEELLAMADHRCFIPMAGFAQSFNVSVAAAITLYHIRRDRVSRMGRAGDLSAEEQEALRAVYYARSVGASRQILSRHTKNQS